MMKYQNNSKCISIGGTGGSGTRLIAEICKQSGVFIGDNINSSNDNLSYPNFLKLVFSKNDSDQSRNAIVKPVIYKFIEELISQFEPQGDEYICWGWKAPGTFYALGYLHRQLPNMRYIHVVRNGLDMAFSKNQNQLNAWAKIHNIDVSSTEKSIAALDYWIKANDLAMSNCVKYMGKNFHIVDFDELCQFPERVIKKLMDFVGFKSNKIDQLINLVIPPDSIGRHKQYNYMKLFSKQQIEKVIEFHSAILK